MGIERHVEYTYDGKKADYAPVERDAMDLEAAAEILDRRGRNPGAAELLRREADLLRESGEE